MTNTATNQATKSMPGKSKEFAGIEYFDVTRAAAFMGVHPGTLKRETAKNKVSHFKMGRDIWYKPEWLKEYIEERTKICIYK